MRAVTESVAANCLLLPICQFLQDDTVRKIPKQVAQALEEVKS